MDEVDAVDELGPVDWIVVEFPGSRFNGQILRPTQRLPARAGGPCLPCAASGPP
jgi:hypothetical protein